jgi:hypothetical protein
MEHPKADSYQESNSFRNAKIENAMGGFTGKDILLLQVYKNNLTVLKNPCQTGWVL